MASQNASLLLDLFVFSRHAVDHDVGESVPPASPDPQAQAVELKRPEPLPGPDKGVGLEDQGIDYDWKMNPVSNLINILRL